MAGTTPFAGAACALDDGLTVAAFTLDDGFGTDDVFAAETLFLTGGLGAEIVDLTTLAGDETDFFAAPPFFSGAAARGSAGFAFGLAVFATEPALDELTFFAAIFIIPKINLKSRLFYHPPT